MRLDALAGIADASGIANTARVADTSGIPDAARVADTLVFAFARLFDGVFILVLGRIGYGFSANDHG
jgi:uncharacterized protein (DUF362 family)